MKKMIKYGVLWISTSLLFVVAIILLSNEVNREIMLLPFFLSGITFGTVVTFLFYTYKRLLCLEKKVIAVFGKKLIGQIFCFFMIGIFSTIIGALLFKLTSVIGNTLISFRTLMLLSSMLGIGGTFCMYLFRMICRIKLPDEYGVSDDGIYVGPVRGDVLLFLTPTISTEDKDEPSLVLAPMSLWGNLKKSEKEPDIGMPHEYALLNACRGVRFFEDLFNNQERLACVMRVGGWIGAMDPGTSKETILEIYKKCCSLNDDEKVSLTIEEQNFIKKHSNIENI